MTGDTMTTERPQPLTETLVSVARLTRDLKRAAATLTDAEARFLVDTYYAMQRNRIRSGNQLFALNALDEPHSVLDFFKDQAATLEDSVKAALDTYSKAHPVGVWAREQKGIGPVLAAGLLAHIDITKATTAGSIWRFAGLDPTAVWGKGEKRPWNARLKVLCWKIGESFVKVSGNPDAYYGQVYKHRKALETARNERGDFAVQAAEALAQKNYSKSTEAYKAYSEGKLPKARIQLRSERYAVKLFLAHLHEVWYTHHYKMRPPLPYPVTQPEHGHYLPPPGWATEIEREDD